MSSEIVIPVCLIEYLEVTEEGNRNNHLFDVLCSVNDLNKRISHQEFLKTAQTLNKEFTTPLEEHEIKATVKSVRSKNYPASCKKFEDHCPGKKKCILYAHGRKPIDFTSVEFLDKRYMLSVWKKKDDYLYVLYDRGRKGDDYKRLTTDYRTPKKPLDLPKGNPIRSRLNDVLKDEYAPKRVEEESIKILEKLEDLINQDEDVVLSLDEEIKRLDIEREMERIDQGESVLKHLEHPLQHIGCIVDWLAAGERTNILLGFLCHLHLIVYGEPINFIAVGKSGDGKTVITTSSFAGIPDENIVIETKPRVAPMFRRSEKDPYFYDGKIVYYGDQGGKHDIEESEEARNIIKELNSEGYANKPVVIKNKDGGWDTFELELHGKPSICYTTVHDSKLDDQEVNRGFVVSPREDNAEMVNYMNEVLSMGGKTADVHEFVKTHEIKIIQNIVRFLKEKRGVSVVNPYMPILKEWVQQSPFIKRDYKKVLQLCKVITLLNFNSRHLWIDGDRMYLITKPEDVILLFQIMKDYMRSIALNLPKSLIDLYEKLKKKYKPKRKEPSAEFKGVEAQASLNMRGDTSFRNKLYALRDAGLLGVGEKDGNANLYYINEMKGKEIELPDITLSKRAKKMIIYEHSQELLDYIIEHEGECGDVNIHSWACERYSPPPWEWREPRTEIREAKLPTEVKEDEPVKIADEVQKEWEGF
jgi:hypothetical protein